MDAIFSMPLVVTVTLIRYPNQKAEKIHHIIKNREQFKKKNFICNNNKKYY